MKIALLSEFTDIGGGESNLLAVANELSKVAEVALFGSGHLYHAAKSMGLGAVAVDLSGRRWIGGVPLVWSNHELSSYLSSFDVLHAYSLNVLPRLFNLNKPIVWTHHGYWEKAHGLRARVISRNVAHVIDVSHDVFNSGKEINTKRSIVPLGVQLDKYEKIQPSVVGAVFKILCIGRFQHIKGQDLLVHALDELARDNTNSLPIEVHFVGDVNGDDVRDHKFLHNIKLLASSIQSAKLMIYFHGFKEDVRPYLINANLVVIPSRYESFSMVAVEALASGRPVIGPDVGGPAEILNSNDIGRLFKAGNQNSLARILRTSIDRYYLFDYNACMKRSRDFSINKQVKRLMNIYSSVI